MRYLADILTLTRIILSAAMLFFCVIHSAGPELAFILFICAELTDAFDGTCARKWPFPKDKTPKYRKYAAKFDMFADVFLAGAQILFVTVRINWLVGLIVIIYYLVSAIGGDLLVYGRILGHPDDCTKNSLAQRNFPLAKRIILTRRYIYTICLGIVNAMILFATNWPLPVKIGLFAFGCSIFIFAWFFLRQRRHNISRDAVDIEQKLTSSAKAKNAKKTRPTSK
ncbi:MAG: CDP-alcohol phosphatidyltransferase family protein [Candidatus Saccharibacteria bacterium]|nr:CDP-alcohol phosphatidyltransferase family protein [Candidatus Saccharibacteria bacterium]